MIKIIRVTKKDDAVTPVVSASLVLFVVTFTVGAIVFWSVPFVDEIHGKEILENAEMQFNAVLDDIDELVYEGRYGTKVTTFIADDGSISIDKEEYNRIIVMYSNTSAEDYNFTVEWSEDDSWFHLGMSGTVSRAVVYWLDTHGIIEDVNTLYPTEGTLFESPAGYSFKGSLNITLYSNNYKSGNDPFGNIWVLDSNFLTYMFNRNGIGQKLILDGGGLIKYDSKNILVKNPFSFYAEEDDLSIGVIQILASDSSSAGGDRLRVSINSNGHGSYIREMKSVYYFRLQFYGFNAPAWLSYFVGKYDFSEFPYNTLFYNPSDPDIFSDGVFLLFSHSVVGFRVY
jgi:hypothetical protein